MPRARKGTDTIKKRSKLLRQVKGYRWNRKSKIRRARQALLKAWTYSYRDRKNRKRDKRGLWQIKINAASREGGITYSQLMGALKKKEIKLDRKILADLAENEPEVFRYILQSAGVAALKNDSSGDEASLE